MNAVVVGLPDSGQPMSQWLATCGTDVSSLTQRSGTAGLRLTIETAGDTRRCLHRNVMQLNELDIAFFRQLREGGQIKRDMEHADAVNIARRLTPPPTLAEMLRLQKPEPVRHDAQKPGAPKVQVVIDDGPNAGMTIATCALEADAMLIVEMWNWQRTLLHNK